MGQELDQGWPGDIARPGGAARCSRCDCSGGPRTRGDGPTHRLNLARAGIPLVVWNRSAPAAEELRAAGGRWAPAWDDLVRGHLVVHMGTTAPSYSEALARDVVRAGGPVPSGLLMKLARQPLPRDNRERARRGVPLRRTAGLDLDRFRGSSTVGRCRARSRAPSWPSSAPRTSRCRRPSGKSTATPGSSRGRARGRCRDAARRLQ